MSTVDDLGLKQIHHCWAIVPASGIGQRMGSKVPKQYLQLGDSSVIEHSIARLLSVPEIEGIVVAVNKEDAYWSTLNLSKHPKVYRVEGGRERMHSVYNALDFLAKKLDGELAFEQLFVMVHDAVRPCVRPSDINNLMKHITKNDDGGILASPLVDTLKRSDQYQYAQETLSREHCWRAFTPQLFRFPILKTSIEAQIKSNQIVSDDSAAVESCGAKVRIIEGASDNLKLTLPSDLPILEAILAAQQVEGVLHNSMKDLMNYDVQHKKLELDEAQ